MAIDKYEVTPIVRTECHTIKINLSMLNVKNYVFVLAGSIELQTFVSPVLPENLKLKCDILLLTGKCCGNQG